MKRLAIFAGCAALAATAIVGTAGASTPPDSSAAEPLADGSLAHLLPEELQGALLISAIGDGFPPAYFRDENSKVVGMTVDISNEIARLLGVEFELNVTAFAGVMPGITGGVYDLALQSADITEERIETVDMVPYTSGGYIIMRRGDEPRSDDPFTWACGKNLAVTAAGNEMSILEAQSAELCAPAGLPDIEMTTFPTQVEATLAVKGERADGALIGAMTAGYIQSQDEGWQLVGDPIVFNNQGFVVPKDSPLGPVLAEVVNVMIENGTYGEILATWNVSEVALIGPSELNRVEVLERETA